MKRYIRSTKINNVFNTESTGMSYYDTFLTDKGLQYMEQHKNLTGSIEYMTPSQYYRECAELFGNTEDTLRQSRNDNSLPKLIDLMKQGVLIDMPVINWADEGQEGLHRMLAAEKVHGADVELPVLVVNIYDEERYNEAKLYEDMKQFERYDLPKICADVVDTMSDWDAECPPFDDIKTEFEDRVEAHAFHEYNVDIEVECEISGNDEDGHRLKCFLISYKDTENSSAHDACNAYIEDMYKMDQPDLDGKIDEYLANLTPEELDLDTELFT